MSFQANALYNNTANANWASATTENKNGYLHPAEYSHCSNEAQHSQFSPDSI